jgi:hypothetical protein
MIDVFVRCGLSLDFKDIIQSFLAAQASLATRGRCAQQMQNLVGYTMVQVISTPYAVCLHLCVIAELAIIEDTAMHGSCV